MQFNCCMLMWLLPWYPLTNAFTAPFVIHECCQPLACFQVYAHIILCHCMLACTMCHPSNAIHHSPSAPFTVHRSPSVVHWQTVSVSAGRSIDCVYVCVSPLPVAVGLVCPRILLFLQLLLLLVLVCWRAWLLAWQGYLSMAIVWTFHPFYCGYTCNSCCLFCHCNCCYTYWITQALKCMHMCHMKIKEHTRILCLLLAQKEEINLMLQKSCDTHMYIYICRQVCVHVRIYIHLLRIGYSSLSRV